ncbi:MAG TPA: HYR domain-containing protein [Verrucomicrobiae bacterium]
MKSLKAPVIHLAGTAPTIWMAIAVAFGLASLPAQAQPPLAITCPTDFSVWTCATNPVMVSYPPPTVTGSCPGITTNCTPRSGTFFPVGVTTVTCEATNSCGEHAACTFTITVLSDTNPPTLVVPSGGNLGCNPAVIPDERILLSQIVVTDNRCVLLTNVTHSDITTGCTSFRTFYITAFDCCSNSVSASVVYTWTVDTTPPSIVCPSNLVVAATSSNGAVVTFTVAATDNCDPKPTVTSTPVSGSVFPIGTNTVVCAALDACGNSNSCSFTVTVVPVPRLVSVGSADGTTIGVRFDMELDRVSAETLGNYTFDTWSPQDPWVQIRPNGREVELTLDQALPAQAAFSITASNISGRGYMWPGLPPLANGQASGRVLRFKTVGIYDDPNLRSDVFTCDNQTLELTGGGGAAWLTFPIGPTTADNIALTYRTLTGDFDVAARVGFPVVDGSNALGGLMVRDSLASTSRMAALVFDPFLAKGIWLVRSNDGGAVQVQGEAPLDAYGVWNWMRLRRAGDTLTGFTSTNGFDWSVFAYINLPLRERALVGFAVGSSQAGEVASSIIPQFQYRNYYLRVIPLPPGRFGFSWYGPATVEETQSVYPPYPFWSPSAVSVEQNADERWVMFEHPFPMDVSSRFFRVQPAPTTNQLYFPLRK